MKDLKEIRQCYRLTIIKETYDGLAAVLNHPALKKPLHIIASWGGGWEHVSVSLPNRCPTWEEMCMVKDIFWEKSEIVMQLHPDESQYVNNYQTCLHLWKPTDQEIPTPPSFMVGLRKGQTAGQLMEEAQEYYAKRGEEL